MNNAKELYRFSEMPEILWVSVGSVFFEITSFATHSFGKCDRKISQLGHVFARSVFTTVVHIWVFPGNIILLVIQSSGIVPAMHWRITSPKYRTYQCFDYMFANFFFVFSVADLTKMFSVITQKEQICFAYVEAEDST